MKVPINGTKVPRKRAQVHAKHSKVRAKRRKVHMDGPVGQELDRLRNAPVSVLVARYEELMGEQPRARNKVFLFRRIAWRLQANAYGGLSERSAPARARDRG